MEGSNLIETQVKDLDHFLTSWDYCLRTSRVFDIETSDKRLAVNPQRIIYLQSFERTFSESSQTTAEAEKLKQKPGRGSLHLRLTDNIDIELTDVDVDAVGAAYRRALRLSCSLEIKSTDRRRLSINPLQLIYMTTEEK